MTSFKYPRTYHAKFSKGLINDDRMIEDEFCFNNKVVEVSVKLDGENTTCMTEGIHARSLSSAHHPSRSWIKGFHATIRKQIPEDWRFCFESMFATHSLHYEDLDSFAYLLNIWNSDNYCLSLKDTLEWAQQLNLTRVKTVDILKIQGDDFAKLEEIYEQVITDGQEGIVIRNVESFHYNDFQTNVIKGVRANHVTTSKHWTQSWVPNKLKS